MANNTIDLDGVGSQNNPIDLSEIEKLKDEVDSSITQIKHISDDIVKSYTSQLDELMDYIKEDVIYKDNVPDSIIESYFMQLTNAMYFIGANCEELGLYEDFAKTNQKIIYSDGYLQSQIKAKQLGAKATIDDHKLNAESVSTNASVVNSIYSRSFRIIKAKLDCANEMIKTLSKILSKRMNEKDYSSRFAVDNDYDNN